MDNTSETPVEPIDNIEKIEPQDTHRSHSDAEENHDGEPTENANPDVVTDELKEIFLVDAIGDTLYSKRFVLKTLLSLGQLESTLSEDFEKDLCTLWDMTIEKDVVRLLLEHNVLEIFANIIQVTEDQRLTEILIGIIGNMCSLAATRDAMCQQSDVMVPIIELISCTDSLILVQLMRVFHSCLVFENSGDEIIWFEHFRAVEQFVEKFAFVLSSSTSTSLLLHAYEALNAICTKLAVIEIQPDVANTTGFRDMFVKPVLVEGVIEAFRQMLPDKRNAQPQAESDDTQTAITDDEALVTKKTKRIFSLFLDINVILSQYEQHSLECFRPYQDIFHKCLARCLEPLCHAIHLLPLTSHEQILIENINEISQALNDNFDSQCFSQVATIWSLVEKMLAEKEAVTNGDGDSEWDLNADSDDVNASDISMTLLEYITRTSKRASVDEIKESIATLDLDSQVLSLCEALSAGASEKDIRDCHDKLKAAAKLIWNVEITTNADCDDDGDDLEDC